MTYVSCHAVELGARRLHPTHWRLLRSRANLRSVGPQDPKDVTRDTARDLSALVGELAALKGDATHWLTGPLPQERPVRVLPREGEPTDLLIDLSPSVTLCRPIKAIQEE